MGLRRGGEGELGRCGVGIGTSASGCDFRTLADWPGGAEGFQEACRGNISRPRTTALASIVLFQPPEPLSARLVRDRISGQIHLNSLPAVCPKLGVLSKKKKAKKSSKKKLKQTIGK